MHVLLLLGDNPSEKILPDNAAVSKEFRIAPPGNNCLASEKFQEKAEISATGPLYSV
jgi:hypothetical protein